MKNLLKLIPLVILSIVISTSCKKGTSKGTSDPNASQHNQDVQNTKSESDNSNTDINSALTNTSGFGKNSGYGTISICGATIDSSQQHAAIPTMTITFDGQTVCPGPNRIRSGSIKVELIAGAHWIDQGAQVRVTYTNYKVTFLTLNNAYVTFNGTKYLTDVNGINLLTIYLGSSTAQVRERTYDMKVTFENSYTSSWNCARLSTWGINNFTDIYATVNGDTIINGKTIDSWGVTRYGTHFTTEMIVPWKSGTVCGWWAPTQGEYKSVTDNFTVSATLGVNSGGNPITSGCAYGFKLDWSLTASGLSGEIVLPYY